MATHPTYLVRCFSLLTFAVAIGPIATASESSSLLDISTDGSNIVCTNRDSGTVSLATLPKLTKQWETRVGQHPEGITFVGSTNKLACCVYSEDAVVILDSTGTVVRRIPVFDEPYGIVSDNAGNFLYVTLEYPGKVIRINCQTWTVDQEWQVGKMLRGIALANDQKSLFVTEFLTSKLIQISTHDGAMLQALEGASTDNLARQVTLHPSRPKAYIPHVRSRTSAAHGNGSIFPYVTVATFDQKRTKNSDVSSTQAVGERTRIPMDTFRGTRVVANPWEVAVSPDGQRLYIVFSATNDLYVANIEDDDYQELTYAGTLRLGNNPRAVRVTPDGKHLLIYNALDFELVAYALNSLKEVARTQITNRPYSEEFHVGKKLFYTANQPMSARQWISCSSCHIDGAADGRTWQQPEGLRQTQPLVGLSATHPLHWSADRDEVQDFEHTIRGQLMQGRGLLRGNLPDAMGDNIDGRSRLLDALALYSNSHDVPISPYSKNGLSAAAQAGQKLFHSESAGCAKCHSGEYYCDSVTGQTPFKLHDVGTGKDDPSELMGTKYDTPTLLGVYRSAPYLHDGSAATLKQLLTTSNPNDQHGKTQHMNEQQISELVQFLKALPFDRPKSSKTASR